MLFSSQIFILAFLPVVLLGFYLLRSQSQYAKLWLLLASCFFYGYWDPRFLPLLVLSCLLNWLISRIHQRSSSSMLIVSGVAINLGLLAVFKYANFISDSLSFITVLPTRHWDIVLPLGISFFTFQQISYLVDLKRKQAPNYSFLDYTLYVCFFPQLIAGPIVRHNEIIPQFNRPISSELCKQRFAEGIAIFCTGLIKKVLIADQLARIADPVFASASAPISGMIAWTACIAFGLQIYFDFSGYSDMAIGLGRLFGYELPENFNAPYKAESIQDFWRRWHITLSSFLRDYLYIPLGGSRYGLLRHAGALLLTMLLAGLWHGASWTFVVWGGLHGLALVIHSFWKKLDFELPKAFAGLLTLAFVFMTWVLFRAENFDQAYYMYVSMFSFGASQSLAFKSMLMILLAALVAIMGPTTQAFCGNGALLLRRRMAAFYALALIYALLQLGNGANVEFIYFQF